MLGGSIPYYWLIIGALLCATMLRFVSVNMMEGKPMMTSSNLPRKRYKVNANSNSVTNVKKSISVSLETVWALIVGWSAGATGPTPSALHCATSTESGGNYSRRFFTLW